jgi:cyclopropane fatty-acyl-phospholipid synthase-like methyltransferase
MSLREVNPSQFVTSRKPTAPHCERNRGPILETLRPHFMTRRKVLEIGSGTGEHAVYFAPALPDTIWQTSDVAENIPGIRAWQSDAKLPNLPPPLQLDVNGPWPTSRFDASFTANTLHIMSWPDVEQLFAGLNSVLTDDALLACYGPFNYGGRFTSESNRAFDAYLKENVPTRGIRDFEAVDGLANAAGFELLNDYSMPANNRLIFWMRRPAATRRK